MRMYSKSCNFWLQFTFYTAGNGDDQIFSFSIILHNFCHVRLWRSCAHFFDIFNTSQFYFSFLLAPATSLNLTCSTNKWFFVDLFFLFWPYRAVAGVCVPHAVYRHPSASQKRDEQCSCTPRRGVGGGSMLFGDSQREGATQHDLCCTAAIVTPGCWIRTHNHQVGRPNPTPRRHNDDGSLWTWHDTLHRIIRDVFESVSKINTRYFTKIDENVNFFASIVAGKQLFPNFKIFMSFSRFFVTLITNNRYISRYCELIFEKLSKITRTI